MDRAHSGQRAGRYQPVHRYAKSSGRSYCCEAGERFAQKGWSEAHLAQVVDVAHGPVVDGVLVGGGRPRKEAVHVEMVLELAEDRRSQGLGAKDPLVGGHLEASLSAKVGNTRRQLLEGEEDELGLLGEGKVDDAAVLVQAAALGSQVALVLEDRDEVLFGGLAEIEFGPEVARRPALLVAQQDGGSLSLVKRSRARWDKSVRGGDSVGRGERCAQRRDGRRVDSRQEAPLCVG
jgi:hypothetical protein